MTYFESYIPFLDNHGMAGKTMKKATSPPWTVAVCIDTRDGAGRKRLHGVAQYARGHAWRMMLVRRSGPEAAQEV